MKITNLELKHLVDEMQFLKGGTIDSIRHQDKSMEMRIIVQDGRYNLFISPDLVYLADKERVRELTEFAMVLRKHLKGKRVESIVQHNFDRIVEIWTDSNILILELDNANYVLCDRSYKIIRPREFQRFDDRDIISGGSYAYPKSLDIRDINSMKKILGDETIFELLNNFFGKYARDILMLAKIERNRVSRELNDEEIMRVKGNINLLIFGERKPQIIYKDNKMDVLLFDLETRGFESKKYFDSFTEALGFFMSKEDKIKTVSQKVKKQLKKKKRKKRKKIMKKKKGKKKKR